MIQRLMANKHRRLSNFVVDYRSQKKMRNGHPASVRTTSSLKFLLISLSLLCLFNIIRDTVAGKGKVPIYMPIPIPIPMPMGPPEGHKFHHAHQQQQQQREEPEGEVKKIYLLQPMPKVHPPPHLKGGGFPVQTHIHMPAPVVQQQHQPQGHSSQSYGDSYGQHNQRQHQQQHHEDTSGGYNNNKHHKPPQQQPQQSYPEMKILPIVVIPPIAPMPPIHLSSSGSTNSHHPRMTFTPHFNNYIMANTEPGQHKSTRSHHIMSTPISTSTNFAQDDKSFGAYGGSVGGAVYRESLGPRVRPAGRGTSGRGYGSARVASQVQSSYERRPNRRPQLDQASDIQYEGDGSQFDEDSPAVEQQARRPPAGYNVQRRARRRGSGSNRRQQHPTRAQNSIRDIIDDQSALFDEELPAADGDRLSAEYDGRSRYQQSAGDCCGLSAKRPRNSMRSSGDTAASGSYLPDANLDNDYVTGGRGQQHAAIGEASELDQMSRTRQSEAGPYYDREPLGSGGRQVASTGRRRPLYLDEREILQDDTNNQLNSNDEWWFDSIKSVSHVSAPQHLTNSTYETINNATISNSSSLGIQQQRSNLTLEATSNETITPQPPLQLTTAQSPQSVIDQTTN